MLMHEPDRSYKRLTGCWKRADSFAEAGKIDPSHPLATAWANCKIVLDAATYECPTTDAEKIEQVASACFDVSCLDWFALRLDEFSKTNMLDGDATVAAILYEWKERMFFDPTKLSIK